MTASAGVNITLSAKDAGVVQALDKINKALDQTASKLAGGGTKGTAAGKEAGGSFQNATNQVFAFTKAILGISSVIGAVAAAANQLKREMENIRRRQGAAAETQLEIADAEREMLGNLPAGLSGDEARKRVAAIRSKTGAGQAALSQAASAALSSKPATLSPEDAFNAVEVAAKLTPRSPETIQAVSRAILVQQGLTGGTAEQIAGFQKGVKSVSPVSSDEAFARNISPAIANLKSFGDSPREAGALLATIGHGAADFQGEQTRTVALRLAQQLQQRLPNVEGGTLGRLRFAQSEAGTEVRHELLGSLAQDAEISEKGGLTGEAKGFTTMVGLLQSGQTEQKELLQKNLAAIPDIANGVVAMQKFFAEVKASPLQRQAALDTALSAVQEGIQVSDIAGGATGISRERLEGILRAAGVTDVERRIQMAGFELNAGMNEQQPLEHVAGVFRGQAARLTRKPSDAGRRVGGFVAPGTPSISVGAHDPTARDLDVAKQLASAAASLDVLVAEQREANRLAREQNEKSGKIEQNTQPRPGPQVTRPVPSSANSHRP